MEVGALRVKVSNELVSIEQLDVVMFDGATWSDRQAMLPSTHSQP